MIYKMLALNIDDTLLQDNGRMNKATREAVEYALGKGIAVTLVTSRHFSSAKRIAKALKTNTDIVSHHGAFIGTDLNKPIFVKRINEQSASEIATLLESFDCRIKLVHESYSLGNKVQLPDNMMARVVFQSSSRFSYPEQYVDSVSEKLIENPVSPPHIEAVFDRQNDLEDAKKAIGEMFDEVHCIQTGDRNLVMVPAGVSKLSGVSYVCERLGIHRDEVVAIGAGPDDLPMVQWAGLGVAMGNAPKEVRDAADWITRSCEENGVAYMVKEHFRKQHRLEFLRKINVIK
ncbi:MAG TPA: Cof-type HAD-IIB family hydrolase [Bacillaceae bacterium]